MGAQGGMISNLQVLRAVAALSVVYYHTDFRIFGVHVDMGGVALFFVISGFIMTYISRSSTDGFLSKRLIRIVPLYWFATIFALVWFNFGFSNPTYVYPLWAQWAANNPSQILTWFKEHAFALRTPDHAWAISRSLLFLPSPELPVLGVGWTLNLEMFFYLLFAGALTISRKWAPLICAAILTFIIILARNNACGSICNTYGHGYIVYFVLGIGCFYIWRWLEPLAIRHANQTAVCCWAVLALWLASLFAPNHPVMVLVGGFAIPAAVVLAALFLHSVGRVATNKTALTLGAASYSIYLMHTIAIETFRTAGTTIEFLAPNSITGMAASIAASVALSLIVYYWFEEPVLRRLRKRRAIGQASGAAAIPAE